MMYLQSTEIGTDNFRGNIKCGLDTESLALKSAITQQGLAQISTPDYRRWPDPVRTQYTADFVNQFFATVTNPRVTKLAEAGKVLTNLGVC